MSNRFEKKIFSGTKRRILGELESSVNVKTAGASVAIHTSSHDQLLTYESKGLVVSINGSGSLDLHHRQSIEAAQLAKEIADAGGIVINGGRNNGIMQSSAQAAGDNVVSVIFPELKKETHGFGKTVVVNSPQPRTELLATCAPVVVIFRGGLGSLMVLMRSIVHVRNQQFHPDQLPQVICVSNYWIGLLSTLVNMGTLPKEFVSELFFFDHVQQISNTLFT